MISLIRAISFLKKIKMGNAKIKSSDNHPNSQPHQTAGLAALSLGALGVVYGDIGTSPLYALKECFVGHHSLPPSAENILGILSLIVWSLTLVISVKYAAFVLRADNNGEGGVLALMALAVPGKLAGKAKQMRVFIMMGLFGAALLYGDGILTPVITVLGAVEGLTVVTPAFEKFVVPITIAILVVLFGFQKKGTAKIGAVFGPVMLVWFLTLSVLGVRGIFMNPDVLKALNPVYGVEFLLTHGEASLWTLGSVFLVVTGGEALYADMGHFGKKPIQMAWFFVAFPALLLNYFGQGALLITDPSAAQNPFYLLAPRGALYGLVILATLASAVASQALISGVFSITRQALQLGYCPRLPIIHTSSVEIGQIYIPFMNWSLLIGAIWLVMTFQNVSNLAGAYGIAVSMTMVITTILAAVVCRRIWGWSKWAVIVTTLLLLSFDVLFLSANMMKLGQGGWFPITIGIVLFTLMTTWKKGRRILALKLKKRSQPFGEFVAEVSEKAVTSVSGTAVFMAGDPESTPPALFRNLKHNKVLHERNILLTVLSKEIPQVASAQRISITRFNDRFVKLVAQFGFQETPNINTIVEAARNGGLDIDLSNTTFFLGRETIIATQRLPGMALWRERLFSLMSKNAQGATAFFQLPPDNVIEIGAQVEI
jgi:KUP system potassium uptake protein